MGQGLLRFLYGPGLRCSWSGGHYISCMYTGLDAVGQGFITSPACTRAEM